MNNNTQRFESIAKQYIIVLEIFYHITMEIRHAIRYLRKQKGWTQQQLADAAHTSKSNISNLENGNQGYSVAILQYLANAFGCSVSQIFLLAENLNQQEGVGHLIDLPIEQIFSRLSPEMQNTFKTLMVQILESGDKTP